jgi:DnaK suppressor protein
LKKSTETTKTAKKAVPAAKTPVAKTAAAKTPAAKPAAKAAPKPKPKPASGATAAAAKSPADRPAASKATGAVPATPSAKATKSPTPPLTKTAADPKPAPVPAPAPAPAPVAAAPVSSLPPDFVPRKAGKGAPKIVVPSVQAPLPPPTSRFADRFAPPRPPTRQMQKIETDTPRTPVKADPKLANAWKSKSGKELTDAEVLAMPESEYMGDKQVEFFRVKLMALKDDLLTNAGETTEHLREDTTIVPDPADRATIEEEHALELRTRDRERKLLKKITQSLGRLESGEYGFCDETGEPIGLGRLIARPTATLSLEAQQRRELKQKLFGD